MSSILAQWLQARLLDTGQLHLQPRVVLLSLEIAGLVHDEPLLLVPEEHADQPAGWLRDQAGRRGGRMNEDAPLEKRVSIKADTSNCQSWGQEMNVWGAKWAYSRVWSTNGVR